MALRPPPEDPARLEGFPSTQLRGARLHRIFRYRAPSGTLREPFHFASVGRGADRGGRYDLPPPHGVCYLAESGVGAWLEVFRATEVVDRADLRARRLLLTRVPRSLEAADLTARETRGFGLTGEIHTTGDYTLPRRWAQALRQAGFRALRGKVRHDPALAERSVTLLDEAGPHLPYGWRWRVEVRRLDDDADLLAEAAEAGFLVAERPYDVDTVPPG